MEKQHDKANVSGIPTERMALDRTSLPDYQTGKEEKENGNTPASSSQFTYTNNGRPTALNDPKNPMIPGKSPPTSLPSPENPRQATSDSGLSMKKTETPEGMQNLDGNNSHEYPDDHNSTQCTSRSNVQVARVTCTNCNQTITIHGLQNTDHNHNLLAEVFERQERGRQNLESKLFATYATQITELKQKIQMLELENNKLKEERNNLKIEFVKHQQKTEEEKIRTDRRELEDQKKQFQQDRQKNQEEIEQMKGDLKMKLEEVEAARKELKKKDVVEKYSES